MTDFRAIGHYHGPDGLNGRVRDGNGCGPASIVAGEPDGGPSGHAGRVVVRRRSVGHAGGPGRGVRVLSWCVVVARDLSPDTCRGMTLPGGSGHAGSRSAVCEAGGSGWSSRLAVRTGRLRRSPAVHSRPIDLVVFQEPTVPIGTRKPGFGGGFALRCLQRLSGPDLATRRCPERDSRYTRGRSSPILSY